MSNIGTKSLLVAETYELRFCFEELASNYKVLKRSLIENNNIHFEINIAASLQTGEQLFITEPHASNSGRAQTFTPETDKLAQRRVEIGKPVRADNDLNGRPSNSLVLTPKGWLYLPQNIQRLHECKS